MPKNNLKVVYGILALSILFALFLQVAPAIAADTYYYVSKTGDNGNDGLTWDTAKLTIQNAVNTADVGDTILVADGTYTENVTVDTGLIISSQNGPTNCIVQPSNLSQNVFSVTSDYVSIIGFTVTNTIARGILLTTASYCVIDNIIAINCGIHLCGNPMTTSGYNIVTNNICENSGIVIDFSDENNLFGNTCSSSGGNGIKLQLSNGNTLDSNNLSHHFYYGIYVAGGSDNRITNNTCESNYQSGIKMDGSSGNVSGNKCMYNLFGIELGGSGNIVTGNTCLNNQTGIKLNFSSNTITGNVVLNSVNDISGSDATTSSLNRFYNNMTSKMLTFTDTDSRIKDVGNTISFSASVYNLDGTPCNGCTTITTYPSETITADNDWVTTNEPQGHFTASQSGTYSLIFTVTDSHSNTTKRRMLFFVGDTVTLPIKYYLRGISPTHGQPWGNGHDSRVLLLAVPTDPETAYCSGGIQVSPDEIPNYYLSNLSAIETYAWYKADDGDYSPYYGVRRYLHFLVGDTVDRSIDVDSTSSKYVWINVNFTNLNWAMDYLSNFYWLALRFVAYPGFFPHWITFPAEEDANPDSWSDHLNEYGEIIPSYANFLLQYTTTPAIKAISDENIMILSATADAADTRIISVTLEDLTTSDTSTMDIVLSSPGVRLDLSIGTWNTSAPYYKQWTEEASEPGIVATHTINGFAPNNYYMVTKDGALVGLYLSDSSGKITFTSPAGSVFAVGGLDTVFQTDGGDVETATKCFIATAAYGTPMASEVKVLSQFRNKYLLTNPIGEVFVNAYYKASPKMAEFISEHPILKNMVKNLLKPVVWISRTVIE